MRAISAFVAEQLPILMLYFDTNPVTYRKGVKLFDSLGKYLPAHAWELRELGGAAVITPAAPIRIGVSLPQSGRDARAACGSHYNAYRLWLEEVNAEGGMLGREVELVVYDDRSLPAIAAENYERLIADEQAGLDDPALALPHPDLEPRRSRRG